MLPELQNRLHRTIFSSSFLFWPPCSFRSRHEFGHMMRKPFGERVPALLKFKFGDEVLSKFHYVRHRFRCHLNHAQAHLYFCPESHETDGRAFLLLATRR